MLTFRQYNDLDFFSKISVFIILHLYLTVFCFPGMLSHLGTLKEMTNENKSNSPSLAASIATFCKLHPKKLSVQQGLKVPLTGRVKLWEEMTKHRDLF